MAACGSTAPEMRKWGRFSRDARSFNQGHGPLDNVLYWNPTGACSSDLHCPPNTDVKTLDGRTVPFYEGQIYNMDHSCAFGTLRQNIKCYRNKDAYDRDDATRVACCSDAYKNAEVQADCEPGYCPKSKACEAWMESYCSSTIVHGEDKGEPCKAWCFAHPGKCDAGARDYCRENYAKVLEGGALRDPFCDCINSPIGGTAAQPTCFDANCITHGYQRDSMTMEKRGNCANVCQAAINCNQQGGGTCNIDHVQLTNICGAKSLSCDPNPCHPGQVCDPGTGQCRGATPCANVVCSPGSKCDPATGACVASSVPPPPPAPPTPPPAPPITPLGPTAPSAFNATHVAAFLMILLGALLMALVLRQRVAKKNGQPSAAAQRRPALPASQG